MALDWDDLRVFLALGEAGTARAASRELAVSHPTITRRLAALEERYDASLVERVGRGYSLTDEGKDVLDTARKIRTLLLGLERRIVGRQQEVAGPIRVSIPTMLSETLEPILSTFITENPEVRLIVASGDRLVDLDRREADVVVRFTNSPPEHLIGRRLGVARVALYGSRAYLAASGSRPLSEYDWVTLDRAVYGNDATFDWTFERVPESQVRFETSSARLLASAIASGIGIGFTVCHVARTIPGLVRMTGKDPDFTYPIWVLTHPELKGSGRVRSLMDHLAAHLSLLRESFDGEE